MKRYLYDQILRDLKKKMVFITGPRQVGKTFLSKEIMKKFSNPIYLNYDNINDLKIIKKMSWHLKTDLLVFDEIHKMKNWKNYVKGVYDSKQKNQSIIVTGSARFDLLRQVGDSLAGRYYNFRLNPFSVKEISAKTESNYDALEYLNKFGGFPEPLLNSFELETSSAENESSRWRNQYFTDLLRDDVFEIGKITELNAMKLLVNLLRSRVGSPISYASIAEDLQISPNTVKKYIQTLEALCVIFLVRPFNKNIARSLLKEPKVYFYDSAFVDAGEEIKLENTVAAHLLKHVQYLHDVRGDDAGLAYLKTKDGKEVDFVLTKNNSATDFIETKLSETKISQSLKYFAARFPNVQAIQLVHNLANNETINGINLQKAGDWLADLSA